MASTRKRSASCGQISACQPTKSSTSPQSRCPVASRDRRWRSARRRAGRGAGSSTWRCQYQAVAWWAPLAVAPAVHLRGEAQRRRECLRPARAGHPLRREPGVVAQRSACPARCDPEGRVVGRNPRRRWRSAEGVYQRRSRCCRDAVEVGGRGGERGARPSGCRRSSAATRSQRAGSAGPAASRSTRVAGVSQPAGSSGVASSGRGGAVPLRIVADLRHSLDEEVDRAPVASERGRVLAGRDQDEAGELPAQPVLEHHLVVSAAEHHRGPASPAGAGSPGRPRQRARRAPAPARSASLASSSRAANRSRTSSARQEPGSAAGRARLGVWRARRRAAPRARAPARTLGARSSAAAATTSSAPSRVSSFAAAPWTSACGCPRPVATASATGPARAGARPAMSPSSRTAATAVPFTGASSAGGQRADGRFVVEQPGRGEGAQPGRRRTSPSRRPRCAAAAAGAVLVPGLLLGRGGERVVEAGEPAGSVGAEVAVQRVESRGEDAARGRVPSAARSRNACFQPFSSALYLSTLARLISPPPSTSNIRQTTFSTQFRVCRRTSARRRRRSGRRWPPTDGQDVGVVDLQVDQPAAAPAPGWSRRRCPDGPPGRQRLPAARGRGGPARPAACPRHGRAASFAARRPAPSGPAATSRCRAPMPRRRSRLRACSPRSRISRTRPLPGRVRGRRGRRSRGHRRSVPPVRACSPRRFRMSSRDRPSLTAWQRGSSRSTGTRSPRPSACSTGVPTSGWPPAAGSTARGLADHPRFFDGFLGHAEQMATALLAVGPGRPDPVLRPAGHARRRPAGGRPGGDQQRRPAAVRELLGVLRGLRPARRPARRPRRAGAGHRDDERRLQPADARRPSPASAASTRCTCASARTSRSPPSTASVTEKKVPLPERWLKGFAEVQVAGSTMAPVLEVLRRRGPPVRPVACPRATGARTRLLWAVPAGRGLRLTGRAGAGRGPPGRPRAAARPRAPAPLRPGAAGVRPGGTARAPAAERVGARPARRPPRRHAQPRGQPRLLRRGRRAARPRRPASAEDGDLVSRAARVRAADRRRRPRAPGGHRRGSASCARSAGWAPPAGSGSTPTRARYFHRELPYDAAALEAMHPRLRDARALVDAGRRRGSTATWRTCAAATPSTSSAGRRPGTAAPAPGTAGTRTTAARASTSSPSNWSEVADREGRRRPRTARRARPARGTGRPADDARRQAAQGAVWTGALPRGADPAGTTTIGPRRWPCSAA